VYILDLNKQQTHKKILGVLMKASLTLLAFLITMLISPLRYAEPGFNGTAPGCGGSGCHTSQAGILTATVQSNLQVKISLPSATGNVAGELVDVNGNVVAVMNPTNNPFTLTAPSAGTYRVNAGYKNPSRKWDSTTVTINVTGIANDLIESTPHTYKLYNNYPNPFNPSTKIFYSVPERSQVTLKIYDMIGNEVASPLNGEKASGNYSFNFDAGNLASGVYFYQLEAIPLSGLRTGFKETKKMILTK
jgi:hypothetical protein